MEFCGSKRGVSLGKKTNLKVWVESYAFLPQAITLVVENKSNLKELVWKLNGFVLTLVICVLRILHRDVDPSEALHLPGVKTYLGVDDVPGQNATGPVIFDEEVFASEKVDLQWDSVTRCNPSCFLALVSVTETLFGDLKTAQGLSD